MGTYYEPSNRATKKQTRRAAQDHMGLATQTKDNRARDHRCISYITIEEKIEAMHLRLSGYAISSALYPLPNHIVQEDSESEGGRHTKKLGNVFVGI